MYTNTPTSNLNQSVPSVDYQCNQYLTSPKEIVLMLMTSCVAWNNQTVDI